MNVNALLVGTLDSLLPTADSVYKGAATEYIVFNYTELPADFADDDAEHYRYLVQVHLYAPLEKNTRTYRREISRRLVAAGFTRPTVTPASDKKGQHYAFECEIAGGVDDGKSIHEVVLEMLVAEAEVIAPAQEAEARAMLSGEYSTGETAQSISYDKKLKKTSDGRAIYVYPKGTRRHGNKRRAAEVAFVDEFGKQGQPARPFIQTANEKAADPATDAAARVYDGFLKSKNF